MTDTVGPVGVEVDPLAPDENAPNGYRVDPKTGERVPKLKSGRPRTRQTRPATPVSPAPAVPPSIEELRAAGFGAAARGEDREPGRDPKSKPPRSREPVDVPPFRAGPIAKGVNRLYRKAGKIIRVLDPELGTAVIACTRKLTFVDDDGVERMDEDDRTVGEAWEELARTNVRIRIFLLKMTSGGAWAALFMAHAPILMALLLKPAVMNRIPMGRFIRSWVDDDDDQEPAGPPMGGMMGMTPDDMSQMWEMAAQVAAQMNMGAGAGMPGASGPVRSTGSPLRAPVVDEMELPEDFAP